MIQYFYEPVDVWRIFHEKNSKDKECDLLLAENTAYGVEITMTMEGDLPVILVTVDDQEIFQEAVVSQDDCKQTVRRAYADYLDDQRIIQFFVDDVKAERQKVKDDVKKNDKEDDHEEEIADREDELRTALEEFLLVVTDGCAENDDEVIEDCLDHFLEYLARKWEYEGIRRPMILEDESGEEFFEEYPYEIMEYDDPYNPLYQQPKTGSKK